MYNISNEAKDALNERVLTTDVKLTVHNEDDTTTLITGDNAKSLKITDNCYNNGTILGTAMSKEVEIDIINNNYNLEDKDIDVEVGVKLPFAQTDTTVNGKNININDVYPRNYTYEFNGESTQSTRSGKNKTDYNNWTVISGGTINKSNDQIVFTTNSMCYGVCDTERTLKPNTTYTAFADYNFTGVMGNQWGFRTQINGTWGITSNSNIKRFTTDITGKVVLAFYVGTPYTTADKILTLNNIRLYEGEYTAETIPAYEPYGISPSPEYPSAITSAGDSNNSISIKSIGKNLFNKNNFNMLKAYMSSNIIETDSPTSSLNRILYISCNSNTTYTVSKTLSVRFRVAYLNTIPAIGSTVSGRIVNDNATSITITTNSTAQYLVVYYMNGNIDTLSEQQIIDSIMIEQASTATEYEPYKESKITIPYVLRSLPNGTRDRIYYSNGKWYDEQKIGTITLNGSEAWISAYNTDTFTNVFELPISGIKPYQNGTIISTYCDKFKNIIPNNWKVSQERITQMGTSNISIRININRLSTNNRDGFKTWLGSNNILVQYELATPIITEITDTSTIEALENIRLYSGITNITSDAPMILTYKAKTPGESYEYIPYGTYKVKSYTDTKSNNTYKLVAYDYMDRLNKVFEDNNEYPITLQEFYENLATQYDIEIEEQELPNQDFIIQEKPYFDGMSGRVVLSAISEIFGSFAKINKNNRLQMYLTNNTNEQISRDNMNSTLEIENKYGPVNSLSLRLGQIEGENVTREDVESIEEYGETPIVFTDNPFVYTQALREEVIDNIFNRIKGFEYIPTTFNSKSLLYYDCGDKIQIQDMATDNYIDTIILNQYIEVPSTRKSKCENKALTKTGIINKYKSDIDQKIKRTEVTVNKQEGRIQLISQETQNLSSTVSELNVTVSGINSEVATLDNSLEDLRATTSQTSSEIKATIERVGGTNLVKNSDMSNGTKFWQAHLKGAYIESDSPPENPSENDFWYCTSAFETYKQNQMYNYVSSAWVESEFTRKYLQNASNLLLYTTSYENDESRINTVSHRYTRIDVDSDFPNATHSFNATNIIPIDINEEYITLSCKVKNNIKLGNIMIMLGFVANVKMPAIENPQSMYEPSIILTPDDYSNELKQYVLTIKVPKKSDYLQVEVGSTPPVDTTKYWMYEVSTGIGIPMKFDGSNWVPYQFTGVVYERVNKTIWAYRALYGAYYKTGFTSDEEFKSIIPVLSFYCGFQTISSATAPTPTKNVYWLDTTANKCKRPKYNEDTFVSWEDTGLTATWVAANIMPIANVPIVPPKGYLEISDLKVEWNSVATRWNRYHGEIYSKNFKMDELGFSISSGNNEMLIDEDEIVATYNNVSIFGINGDLCFTRRFKAEQEIALGNYKWYLANVGGNNQMLLN